MVILKVLIVDDSLIICARLVTLLSCIKGVVIVGQAQNGDDGYRSIVELKPDVVLLDIQMPRGGGISVLEKLKHSSLSPTVIMLTNYPYAQYRNTCMKLGAHFFFDKSAEFEKVVETITQLRECHA